MVAQIVTISELPETYRDLSPVQKVVFDWKSATGGAVANATTIDKFTGAIYRVETIPDAGDTAPTSYSITIKNEDGVDVLSGKGASRSATATETLNASDGLGCVLDSTLTLAVSGAGDENGGTVILYIV